MATLNTLKNCVKHFWRDDSGNFAMLTGLAAIVVIFSAGLGIDHLILPR